MHTWFRSALYAALILLFGLGGVVAVAATRPLVPWIVPALFLGVLACALLAAVATARPAIEASASTAQPETGASATDAAAPLRRLRVDVRGVEHMVRAEDVDWFEAKGNYARLHTSGQDYLYRASLAELERQLDRVQFARVHRSVIVNVAAVEHVEPLRGGDGRLRLRSGVELRLSRRYARAFRHRLGGVPQ